jgi:predicted nucleic acid-binding protein
MRIYVETSVFNRYFEDGRGYNIETRRLFERFEMGLDEPFTSVAVIEEIENAPEPKRSDMLNLIPQYNIQVLEISNYVVELAETYIAAEIIPAGFRYDCIHIAVAAVNNMDCIVSLNFRHINKLKTKTATRVANLLRGYSNPDICTPMEVI